MMMAPDTDRTNFVAAKRALLQIGRERGHVTEAEISEVMPLEHTSATELEMLLFTLEMMEVEVRKADGSLYEGAARIQLVGT
jgi:hypothetical protein